MQGDPERLAQMIDGNDDEHHGERKRLFDDPL